jgi:ribosomal protein L11
MLKVRFKSNKCSLKLYAHSAEQSGLTNLTNIGVQTQKFAKDFNEYTKDLPDFLEVRLEVTVDNSKNYSYEVFKPSTGHLINLCKFEKVIKLWEYDRFNDVTILCILLKDVITICLFKFPTLDIKESFLIIFGTIKSMNLKVLYKNEE